MTKMIVTIKGIDQKTMKHIMEKINRTGSGITLELGESTDKPRISSVEQFRAEIWEHYRKALEDCSRTPENHQLSSPLASLYPSEYYAWCLKQDLQIITLQLKLQRKDKS